MSNPNPDQSGLNPPWTSETAPKGQKRTAGAIVRSQINALIQSEFDEAGLRKIARDKSIPVARRMAAMQILKATENSDLADFDGYIDGSYSLSKLRDMGIDTSVVKKAKVSQRSFGEGESETTREVELRDRASEALDKIIGHTAPTINEEVKNARLDEGQATDGMKIEVRYVDRITPLPKTD